MTRHASVEFCKFARSFDLQIHVDFSWCHARFNSGFPRLRSLISFSKACEWWMNKKWSGFDVNHMTNKFLRCARTKSKHSWEILLTQTFSLIYFPLSTESGVTQEEKRLILEEHNYLRQTVATGHVSGQLAAQNMQEMQWDDELAAKAQQWANECTFQHDPSRYLGEFKFRRDHRGLRQGVVVVRTLFMAIQPKLNIFYCHSCFLPNNDEPNWMEIEHKWGK